MERILTGASPGRKVSDLPLAGVADLTDAPEAFRVERYQALDGVARNAGTVDDGAPRESLKASAPKRAVKRRAAGGPYS